MLYDRWVHLPGSHTPPLACRYEHMDGDLGIVIEPDTLPEDIYPFCLVDDEETGVSTCTCTHIGAMMCYALYNAKMHNYALFHARLHDCIKRAR